MSKILSKARIEEAFKSLDREMDTEMSLLVGGGGALICAYKFPLATEDVDAVPIGKNQDLKALDEAAKRVAEKLTLASDWLNPYYSTFMHVLPQDYAKRLRLFFKGKKVSIFVLGPEDLLIMKCFAGRDKDIPHARALLKETIDLKIVEERILELKELRVKGTQKALDFFDEITGDL